MANPQHYTLVANTVKTFTLDKDYSLVEVTNVDGAGKVFVTFGAGVTVTVGGDGCDVLPAAIGFTVFKPGTTGLTVVNVKVNTAVAISVRGIPS